MIRTSLMTDAEFLAFVSTHPVSGGKGDSTAQSSEKSQQQFSNVLQGAFKQNFGTNTGILNFLNGKLTAMATNPTGFTPQTMAALTTNAVQQSAIDTQNAQRAAQASAAAHGGNGLPSGVQAQIAGEIASAGANEEAGNLNQIQLANAQQQQSNYWKAIEGLGGVASATSPTAYAGAETGAANSIAGLSEANTQASAASPFNQFLGGLGKGLGAGLGSFATGGLSNLTNWGSQPGQK